ncbi:MAG: tRNA adenosine(34) deaminase TadA [Gracilibacteraceae bacterium]|jgi:tRNA(adenine34) deaminase|nr:tRNA adenosine(34) deaminase TadA [Gracilibacteraceae bacterium]
MNRHDPPRHRDWMRLALAEASRAAAQGEAPVGAVIVRNGILLARAHNEKEAAGDPTAHAEILAIRRAAAGLGGWRLSGAVLYATLEPCPMCAGAIIQARLARLVYGAADCKGGGVDSVMRILTPGVWNHQVEVTAGVLADESALLLREFFQAKRRLE